MIVEVIARQIGEASRSQPYSVQPILGEAMARSFEREVGHAVVGEPGKRVVQRNGVGSGVGQIFALAWSHYAERPHARRAMTHDSQIWRRKETIEVFPLVPVTATTISGWLA